MSTKLSDMNWQDLLNKHGSAKQISIAEGIKYQTVFWHFKRLGLITSNKAAVAQRAAIYSNKEIIDKYLELDSIRATAKVLGIAKSYVTKIIPQLLLDNNACTKYACNENFFNSDTEQSFYWAGFIMADGCVKLKNKKYKQLSIGLALIDKAHLEKFKKCVDFEGPISERINTEINGTITYACELTISSDAIFNSLARFDIVQRKSLIAKFPEWLIAHPLKHHFMRGYFDGDGSIYTQDTRYNGRPTYFFSTRGTPAFLNIYRGVIEKNTCVKPRTKPIRISSGQGVLEYGGNTIMQSIRNFLYKDATIWLDRKRAIFFDPQLKNYPKGPMPII